MQKRLVDRSPSRASLPDFTPVPRKYRHDGWTPERQRDFIAHLADTGSVKVAAARIGMAPEGAYQLRRQPGADSFAAAWLAALDHGIRQLEDVALERAIHGVEVPVYSYGKLIGSRRVYNDRLLMFMLRNRLDDRYTPSNMHPRELSEKQKEALKIEWMREGEGDAVQRLRAALDEVRRRAAEQEKDPNGPIRIEGETRIEFERWQRAKAEGRARIEGEG